MPTTRAAVWSWQDGGGWHAYPPGICDELDAAHARRDPTCDVGGGRHVDLRTMRQVVTCDAGRWRKVKLELQLDDDDATDEDDAVGGAKRQRNAPPAALPPPRAPPAPAPGRVNWDAYWVSASTGTQLPASQGGYALLFDVDGDVSAQFNSPRPGWVLNVRRGCLVYCGQADALLLRGRLMHHFGYDARNPPYRSENDHHIDRLRYKVANGHAGRGRLRLLGAWWSTTLNECAVAAALTRAGWRPVLATPAISSGRGPGANTCSCRSHFLQPAADVPVTPAGWAPRQ